MKCPHCGGLLGDTTCVSDAANKQPKSGDVAVCFYCAGALMYRPTIGVYQAAWEPLNDEQASALAEPYRGLIVKLREALHKRKH